MGGGLPQPLPPPPPRSGSIIAWVSEVSCVRGLVHIEIQLKRQT